MNTGDGSHSSAVVDDQAHGMLTRRCYIEYHSMRSRARLPKPFARSVDPLIGNYVILQDPNENQIEVSVKRKRGRLYLAQGWSSLEHFYNIRLGCWIALLYMSPSIFEMTIHTSDGTDDEISYPLRNPPYRLMLPKPLGEGSSQRT